MWLYLVRHGDATPVDDWTGDDATRPLTEQGETQVRAAAHGLARLALDAEVILTSPRLRADQTARMLSEELRLPVTTCEPLGGGFDIAALAALLPDVATASGVILIGHEPDLSELAGTLCAQDDAPARLHIRKMACCALKLPRHLAASPGKHGRDLIGAARLEWLVTAPQLALIGTAPGEQPAATNAGAHETPADTARAASPLSAPLSAPSSAGSPPRAQRARGMKGAPASDRREPGRAHSHAE